METIGSLTNVFFVGGSGSDMEKLGSSYLYANGNYYENSSILMLLVPKNGFEVVKDQSFTKTEKKAIVTKAKTSGSIFARGFKLTVDPCGRN